MTRKDREHTQGKKTALALLYTDGPPAQLQEALAYTGRLQDSGKAYRSAKDTLYRHSQERLTRNSSANEIANVNFLALGSGYVLERRFTKFSEITQCNGHYAIQGYSNSPNLVPISD